MKSESAAIYSSLATDPNLGALVELYVAEMSERTAELVDLIEDRNWSRLHAAARHVKGSSCSYGFDRVTDVASRLEEKLKSDCSEDVIERHAMELVRTCRCLRARPRQANLT